MTRNLVLICLDAVRKDFFDEYASRIRELSSLSYDQARAASCWSVPSHASMMTGALPSEHGVHSHHRDFSSTTRAETFLSELSDHVALGVSANTYASSMFGFDAAFDDFVDVPFNGFRFTEGLTPRHVDLSGTRRERYVAYLRRCLDHEHPFRSIANGVLDQSPIRIKGQLSTPFPGIRDNGTRRVLSAAERLVDDPDPYFLFLNLMDGHSPQHHVRGYDREIHGVGNRWSSRQEGQRVVRHPEQYEEYLENYRAMYAASIDYLDRHVADFVSAITSKSNRETTVVVTADHGENLGLDGDDGMFGHTSSLSEGLLHVPMEVINPPESGSANVEEYVSHLRLGELLAGFADGECPDVTRPRIRAETVGQAINIKSNPSYWDRMLRCHYEGGRKLVWDSLGVTTEYEVGPGSNEQRTRETRTSIPPEDETFDAAILNYKRTALRRAVGTAEDDLDADVEDRLRDLGYV
ncbi:MAG: sulfatase-like hydrolase/transferase [Haloferacaceae archaeon]